MLNEVAYLACLPACVALWLSQLTCGLPLLEHKRPKGKTCRRLNQDERRISVVPFLSFRQMAACTCHCSTASNNVVASGVNQAGQEQQHHQVIQSSPSPSTIGRDYRETSAASSHYFSPVSSFSGHHNDDSSSKDPDSLEYRHGQSVSLLNSFDVCCDFPSLSKLNFLFAVTTHSEGSFASGDP